MLEYITDMMSRVIVVSKRFLYCVPFHAFTCHRLGDRMSTWTVKSPASTISISLSDVPAYHCSNSNAGEIKSKSSYNGNPIMLTVTARVSKEIFSDISYLCKCRVGLTTGMVQVDCTLLYVLAACFIL